VSLSATPNHESVPFVYDGRASPADYPQCLLKLGRFRGTEISGAVIDNRQEHMHVFAMVREAMAFLDRTLPLSAHFTPGVIQREDRLARTGAVEIWGWGTNRITEECLSNGLDAPSFEDVSGYVYVTFKAPIGPGAASGRHQVGTKLALSEHQVTVLAASGEAQPLKGLMARCGRSDRTKSRKQVLRPLLDAGLLELTIPDKPRSSLQRYRATDAGRAAARTSDGGEEDAE